MPDTNGRRRTAWALSALCAVMLALAGCGGDDAPESGDAGTKAAPEVAERVEAAAPLTGAGAGDGEGESYVPEGELVADSGFRPGVDGFSFPNYGNDVEPQNLTPANVEALFGEQVCVSGTGEDCVLIPAGQKWMDDENETMGGGHCMGFSVASLRMFADTLEPSDFGAEITNELELQDNNALQATIAESFVYQSIPSIADKSLQGPPSAILDAVIKSLNEGKDFFTLGFYKADGTGGHAVTPLAVEDKGDGQYALLIYDNNYPDTLRAFEIDKNANTFKYNGSPNPDVEPDLYEGGADTPPMVLFPTLVGENLQPCPFCDGELIEEGAEETVGSVPAEGEQYAEIALVGETDNHPHLILSDTEDESKQTGIIDGKLVEDIEGVEVVEQFNDDPSAGVPEPKFRVPVGMDVAVTIDGTDLKKKAKGVSVNYTADGKVIEVEDITIDKGQQDTMFVTADSYTIVYETNNEDGDAPSFFAGVDEKDASYTLGATVVGVEPGSLLGLSILQDAGQVLFDTSDAKAADGGAASVILAIEKLDESGEEQVWLAEDLEVDTGAKEDSYLNYKEQELTPGEPIDIEVGPEDGPFRTVEAAFQEG